MRGLASPHPFLGAIPLAVVARVVLASAFVEGDMEFGWFLPVAGCERGADEFSYAVRGCDMGRDWILQVAVWRMGAFERRLLAAVVDVSVTVLRRVLEGASASVHRQSGGCFSCFTETGLTVQIV